LQSVHFFAIQYLHEISNKEIAWVMSFGVGFYLRERFGGLDGVELFVDRMDESFGEGLVVGLMCGAFIEFLVGECGGVVDVVLNKGWSHSLGDYLDEFEWSFSVSDPLMLEGLGDLMERALVFQRGNRG
jgi:hypothetical protein